MQAIAVLVATGVPTLAPNEISTKAAILAAVCAAVSALVAVAALWIQERRARNLLAIELLFKFDDRFNSEPFKRARASAARALRDRNEDCSDVDDVLDFFETIGLLARRKAVDPEMVWSSFFYWLDGYWHAARDYIKDVTSDDQTVWEEMEYLHSELRAVERKRTECTDADLTWSREDMEAFIEDEASLLATTPTRNRSASRRANKRPSRKADTGPESKKTQTPLE